MRPPCAALHPANPAEPTSDADDHAYQDTTACTDHALLVSKKCRFVIGGADVCTADSKFETHKRLIGKIIW